MGGQMQSEGVQVVQDKNYFDLKLFMKVFIEFTVKELFTMLNYDATMSLRLVSYDTKNTDPMTICELVFESLLSLLQV